MDCTRGLLMLAGSFTGASSLKARPCAGASELCLLPRTQCTRPKNQYVYERIGRSPSRGRGDTGAFRRRSTRLSPREPTIESQHLVSETTFPLHNNPATERRTATPQNNINCGGRFKQHPPYLRATRPRRGHSRVSSPVSVAMTVPVVAMTVFVATTVPVVASAATVAVSSVAPLVVRHDDERRR